MPLPNRPDRLCLFLDVDGSLIDIAASPTSVVVPPSLIDDLARTEAALDGAVALISGRSIAQLDALFAPLKLRASGVHGAEMRLDPDSPTLPVADAAIDPAVHDDLLSLLADFPGTFVEDKVFSLAVHYRAAPAMGAALARALESLIARHAEAGLGLMAGHFVIEVKRPTFDKGGAVRRFLARPPFEGRTPVFIGDDITDRPGFAAVIAAGGAAYGVGQQFPDTTGTFDSPSAVRAWLGSIASQETMSA